MAKKPVHQTSDRSRSFKPKQKPTHHWLKHKFDTLSIRQQIGLGYTVTMAIAVLGTMTGLAIAHQSQKPAYEQMLLAHQQEKVLSNLHLARLKIPFYRYSINSNNNKPSVELEQQKKLWLADVKAIQEEFYTLEAGLVSLSKTYPTLNQSKAVIESYGRELQSLLDRMEPLEVNSENIKIADKLLSDFLQNPAVQEFDRLSDEANTLTSIVHQRFLDAGDSLDRATILGQQVILSSLFLSVLFAIGFIIYTSRAIAHPLEEITQVSDRVTSESNFTLQVSAIKDDEIGRLAISLNQLISSIETKIESIENQKDMQLFQNEKMITLGKMLAGIAHEVNNPLNYIYGNIEPAKEHFEDIFSLLDAYESEVANPPPGVQAVIETIELDFIKEDLRKILQSMQLGAERARSIVVSLKNLSRSDNDLAHPVNLHECIDSTLIMLDHRLKKGITAIKHYGNIPKIEGYAGLLYQVFMNLLSNAMDALEEARDLPNPKIVISTEIFDEDPEYVMVKIADNGTGIESEKQGKIFQTFFTTKPRGIGTGLGLAITRKIVEEKYAGKLICHSEVGEGTEFSIILPIKAR